MSDQMTWFGPNWGAPLNKDCREVETPVGQECIHCREEIELGDEGVCYAFDGPPVHRNCFLRQIVGSLAHIEKRCSCYDPFAFEGDPTGMTRRQAADAAVAAWERLRGRENEREA